MPSFSHGILSIILLSLYVVFLSTVIFHKYAYLNHFPLLVNFSFLYKTITSYSHFFILNKLFFSFAWGHAISLVWGRIMKIQNKVFVYFYLLLLLWQNFLSLTNVKLFSGYSMKHVFTNQSINMKDLWKTLRRIWIMVQIMV